MLLMLEYLFDDQFITEIVVMTLGLSDIVIQVFNVIIKVLMTRNLISILYSC